MVKVLNQKNKMRTVLITGSNGGIGKDLCTTVLNNGYKVIATDRFNDDANHFEYNFIKANLLNLVEDKIEMKIFSEKVKEALKQDQLYAIKFEKAKQLDPWQLISEPTVEEKKIAPKRLNITLFSLLGSLIVSSLLSILYERFKGNLYELEDIRKNIYCKYLETLYLNKSELSKKLFINSINNFSEASKGKNGLLILQEENDDVFDSFIKQLTNSKNIEILSKENIKEENLNSIDNIFLLIQAGKVRRKELILISKYIKSYKLNLRGWFFLVNNF